MARLEDTSGGREVIPTDSATSRIVSVDQREVIVAIGGTVVVVVFVGGGSWGAGKWEAGWDRNKGAGGVGRERGVVLF